MRYCELFVALRDRNPGFEIADYVIQVGAEMLVNRVEPDLHASAIASADAAIAEAAKKKAEGKKVQPMNHIGAYEQLGHER